MVFGFADAFVPCKRWALTHRTGRPFVKRCNAGLALEAMAKLIGR
jgi:hypothetical protein